MQDRRIAGSQETLRNAHFQVRRYRRQRHTGRGRACRKLSAHFSAETTKPDTVTPPSQPLSALSSAAGWSHVHYCLWTRSAEHASNHTLTPAIPLSRTLPTSHLCSSPTLDSFDHKHELAFDHSRRPRLSPPVHARHSYPPPRRQVSCTFPLPLDPKPLACSLDSDPSASIVNRIPHTPRTSFAFASLSIVDTISDSFAYCLVRHSGLGLSHTSRLGWPFTVWQRSPSCRLGLLPTNIFKRPTRPLGNGCRCCCHHRLRRTPRTGPNRHGAPTFAVPLLLIGNSRRLCTTKQLLSQSKPQWYLAATYLKQTLRPITTWKALRATNAQRKPSPSGPL